MSTSTHAREPTWAGLSPGLPRWQPADPADARIVQVAGLDGRLLAQVPGSGASAGLYRLERDGALPLFLKKAGADRRALLQMAEALARWLDARGVSVATALAGFPLLLPDGALLVAMPYVDGRRVAAEAGDLAALGRSLRTLHEALSSHPDVEAWRAATRARLDRLQATRAALAEGRLAAGPDHARLARLAAEPELDFVDAGAHWQPLHGDLNPGNVLMAADTPVLLDFEDVPHSMHPPIAELCLAVERFVLAQVANEDEALRLGRVLVDNYGSPARQGSGMSPTNVLRSRALRSLSLLADAERAGVRISEAEWRKFFDLEQMASSRAATLEAVFR